jgi:hypothetical protein
MTREEKGQEEQSKELAESDQEDFLIEPESLCNFY